MFIISKEKMNIWIWEADMGDKVLIIAEDNFRDEEIIYPYYRFIEADLLLNEITFSDRSSSKNLPIIFLSIVLK